eukprot:scaffold87617_cov61-Attheya_sp.AAC.7
MIFDNREDLEEGVSLIQTFHQIRPRNAWRKIWQEHEDRMYVFPAFLGTQEDESNRDIKGEGHVVFTTQFKYLGLLVTSEKND